MGEARTMLALLEVTAEITMVAKGMDGEDCTGNDATLDG